MKKEYKIFSQKDVSSEEQKQLEKEYVDKRYEVGKEFLGGELEKTEEEIAFINIAWSLVQEEIKKTGLPAEDLPDQARIHFLSRISYREHFPDRYKENAGAFYYAEEKAIYLNKDAFCDKYGKLNKTNFYRGILEEMIHALSYATYLTTINSKTGESNLGPYRSGYMVFKRQEGKTEHFRGLNEAVVNRLVFELTQKNQKILKESFEVSLQELQKIFNKFEYRTFLDVMDAIIKNISEANGESRDVVWKRFKKGLFTGEMMHLRDVERAWKKEGDEGDVTQEIKEVYGKDALKMLALLGSEKEEPEPKVRGAILAFFTTKKKELREELTERILYRKPTED